MIREATDPLHYQSFKEGLIITFKRQTPDERVTSSFRMAHAALQHHQLKNR